MEPVANQANAKSTHEIQSAAWLIVAAAALRTAFGILMALVPYIPAARSAETLPLT